VAGLVAGELFLEGASKKEAPHNRLGGRRASPVPRTDGTLGAGD
jgi:hypothetical protein